MSRTTEIAAFGGGCFWCTEAVFSTLKGVVSVIPGYTGGVTKNPTYEEVCSGRSGHAEGTKIEFDPSQISFNDLLTVFFATHDPTTLNRQGSDIGTQYRSAIFYSTDKQKQEAVIFIADLNEGSPSTTLGVNKKVVTELAPLGEFYPAEEWHREYYFKNSDQPYCQLVISPKLEKLQATYAALMKK